MPRWNYEEIEYEKINKKSVENNNFLFKLIAVASFIEITSDVYEKNLHEFYKEDKEITSWLKNVWEVEEIQHGKALRKYVKSVWSDFDWQKAYEEFKKEYIKYCSIDEFQPTKAKEMLARMVVETGTSTFYKALSNYAKDLNEPILEEISHNIHKDEVYHYEIFNKGFNKYNEEEKLGKKDILKVIYSRLKEANDEDVAIAYKYIDKEGFENFHKDIKNLAKKYYPYKMAVKMLMYPLHLNKYVENVTSSTIQSALKVFGI